MQRQNTACRKPVQNFRQVLLLIGLMIILAACEGDSDEATPEPELPTLAEATQVVAVEPTEAPTDLPTAVPTDAPEPTPTFSIANCNWQIVTQPQDELIQTLTGTLSSDPQYASAELSIEVTTSGDLCEDPAGELVEFDAQQTNFNIGVHTVADAPTGEMMTTALNAIVALGEDAIPGWMDPLITIQVSTGDVSPPTAIGWVRVEYPVAVEALESGATGITLIESLSGVAQ